MSWDQLSVEWDSFWNQVIAKEAYRTILNGLKTTAIIAVVGLFIGILLGSLLALMKLLPGKRWYQKIPGRIADVYIAIFRGTPMVVQLLVLHFVLRPLLGLNLSALTEAVLAFGMNSGAYVSEIMRGGILSVDKGQTEAGRAMGLGYMRTMGMIVIPQAIKNVVPTLGNEFITLLKETSVVSFIAVVDITRAFQNIAASNYKYIITYLMLAVVYLVIILLVTLLVHFVERRMRASDRD